jgi:polyhydroxybutyrate depolymerase
MTKKHILLVTLWLLAFSCSWAQQTITKNMLRNGITREYIIYIPAIVNNANATPLLFNFHGNGGTANSQMMLGTGMRQIADTAGCILVYPQGTLFNGSTHWNVGSVTLGSTADDIGFTEAIIDTLAANYTIDLNRVYGCGFSNGGYFCFELACKLSNKIVAIGSVGGTMSNETYNSCNPLRPIPVLTINGTQDSTVYYNGGKPINSKSLDSVNNYWVGENNTDTIPGSILLPNIDTTDGSTVE